MINWLVENWYFIYIPIHLVLGLLGWAWFNYSSVKSFEKEYGVALINLYITSRPITMVLLVDIIASIIAGPVRLLINVIYYFSPIKGVKMRWGLKFL